MKTDYPNLELLEYKSRDILMNEEDFLDFYLSNEFYPDFVADVFSQTWTSTALGFGGWGGQAFTTAYTTVMHEINSNFYLVFFDEHPAYIVRSPKDSFFEDLRDRNMASIEEAKGRY